jgi:hypothetical protein
MFQEVHILEFTLTNLLSSTEKSGIFIEYTVKNSLDPLR